MCKKISKHIDIMSRSRRFAFTNFDISFDYTKAEDSCSYLIVGLETCPTTKKQHHQGYIEFKEAKTISSVKKKLGTAHIEIAKGNSKQNIAYCSKEQVLFFFGEPTEQGKRQDLVDIRDKIKSGKTEQEISTEHFTQWCQYRRAFKEYKQIIEPKRNWITEVIYIYGPSGTGKTKMAKDAGASTVYFERGFFRGYDGEDIVLFDDIDANTFNGYRSLLLQLLDRYDMNINIKGGERNWKPKTIYITSNYDLWENDDAIMRRITKKIFLDNNIEHNAEIICSES